VAPAFHQAYGLFIDTNLAIPGLPELTEVSQVDVKLRCLAMPADLNRFFQSWQPSTQPMQVCWQRFQDTYWYLIRYSDGTEFAGDRYGREIWTRWTAPMTLEDMATYLLGPIFGLVLRLRGQTCLHASSVAIAEQAIVLVGRAGSGKSTTAAALAHRGYPVLCEDVAALITRDSDFWVQPAYPRIRLWPNSVAALYGRPDALPPLTPNWNKHYLDLQQGKVHFQASALPLAAVYVLSDRQTEPYIPQVKALSPQTGLLQLTANTYASGFLNAQMRADEFDCLARLVNQVPIRQVIPHKDLTYLPLLCDRLVADAQTLISKPR